MWSCTLALAAVTTTGLIRPESLSTAAWIHRFAGLRLHPEIPLVALLGLAHLQIALSVFVLLPPAHSVYALVEVELGAAIKVASTIVTCRIVIPYSLRWTLTVS